MANSLLSTSYQVLLDNEASAPLTTRDFWLTHPPVQYLPGTLGYPAFYPVPNTDA